MIVVENVRAVPAELRPICTGWESVTRWAGMPSLIQFGGLFAIVIVVAASPARDGVKMLALGLGLATLFGWFAMTQWLSAQQLRVARSTPSGSQASVWTITESGVGVRNGHAESRMDWSGIRGVVREHDRYVFLFSPNHNPVLPRRLLTTSQEGTLRDLMQRLQVQVTEGLPPGVD